MTQDLAILDAVNQSALTEQPNKLSQEEFLALTQSVDQLRARIAGENYRPNRDELRTIVAYFRARRENNFVLKQPKGTAKAAAKGKPKATKKSAAKRPKLTEEQILALF